jgi:hypothetical protein
MYKNLFVDVKWIKNGEERLLKIFHRDVNRLRKKQEMPLLSKKQVLREINKTKFFKVNGRKCIDFKDLNVEMQLNAIKIIFADEEKTVSFIKLNPVVKKILKMVKKRPTELVKHNKKVIMQKYSLKAKAKRLKHFYSTGTKNYLRKIKQGKTANAKVIAKYLDLDYAHPLTVD